MSKRILLIEDEAGLARMYKDVFEKRGFEVELAVTADQGWESLKKNEPDLILLDILLPKESGIDFLEKMREEDDYEDLTVVVLSNYDARETKERAEELGVKSYLMKADFTPKELIKEVKKHIK